MAASAGASGRADVRIDAPDEYIVTTQNGARYISFGEDPDTIRFRVANGVESSAPLRVYWEFDGGTPSRVPAQGFTTRSTSGPIRFAKAGEARLYVAAPSQPDGAVEKDTLHITHITFDSQPVGAGNAGDKIYDEVPDNAILDGKGRMELETHFIRGIDLKTHAVLWEHKIDGGGGEGRLMWLNSRILVGTSYGRRFSAYGVIDLLRGKELKHGGNDQGRRFLISTGKLLEVNPETGRHRTLFSVPQARN